MVENDPNAVHEPPKLLLVDSTKFCKRTGYTDPVPLQAQIQNTLKWGLENPETLGPKPDYDAEKRMIDRYHSFLKQI